MTTQGDGVHPIEGVLQPLGTIAYLFLLRANRDGERVGLQGAVFRPSDWYLHTRGAEH